MLYIIQFNRHHLRGEERELKATVIFTRTEESVYRYRQRFFALLCLLFACSLSIFCFQFSVRCSLSINLSQLSSAQANCVARVGGLRSMYDIIRQHQKAFPKSYIRVHITPTPLPTET